MKVTSIDVAPLTYKLKKPFVFSGVRLERLEYAIVRLKSDAGAIGYGECPAYWEPRGETQASTIKALELVKASLIGKNFASPESWGVLLPQILPKAYAAACGLDIALHDALGTEEGKPVSSYYGVAKPVPVEAAIPMVAENEVEVLIAEAIAQGITTYKVKVGIDTEREHGLLQRIRKAIASGATLFVDANQGWKTLDAAKRALEAFSDIGLAWVEQPLPAGSPYEDLRELLLSSNIPIMLDESTYVAADVDAAVQQGGVKLFNIKLAKAGGIWGAHAFAKKSEANGAQYMLGSMIEGALGTYAGLHFAAPHNVRTTALNAYTFIDDEKAFGPTVKDGFMEVPTRPGLGYEYPQRFAACFSV